MSKKIVNDKNIICVWKCDSCKEISEVNPNWYQDNGTLTCIECNEHMEYMYTYIINENK